MNSFGWYLLGIILLLDGMWALFGGKTSFKGKGWVHPSIDYSILMIILGSIFLIGTRLYFKNKQSITKYTICPNCKQTYNFKDLKDGKCPTCKDTNTIEIEQYYKDNPFKDEDEN